MLTKAILALVNNGPICWVSEWRNRANTALMASWFEGNKLTVRDVLPGPAYSASGPWTDAEQRLSASGSGHSAMPQTCHRASPPSPDLPEQSESLSGPSPDPLSASAATPVARSSTPGDRSK